MKYVFLMLAVVAALMISATASAKSSFNWNADDKFAMVDDWSKMNREDGYRYPTLYADCLQKATAKVFPTYQAFIFAKEAVAGRFLRSVPVRNCIIRYGQKYGED